MTVDHDDAERAVDQLIDEITARAWALHTGSGVGPDPTTPVAHHRIATHAAAIVTTLLDPARPSSGTSTWLSLLWPYGAPALNHPWWATPLGTLIARNGAPQPVAA